MRFVGKPNDLNFEGLRGKPKTRGPCPDETAYGFRSAKASSILHNNVPKLKKYFFGKKKLT